MKSDSIWIRTTLALAAGALCLAVAVSTSAQVQTHTTTTTGKTTHEVEIQNGEVVAVDGNHLFVKMSDGTLRDFPNVPESAKATVDGQQLGIHELKPGMKLQHTTITSTTPQVVTTVETVTGKVWHVTPPLSVILTMENGQNQSFKIPDGQKFMVSGQETDAWGLKKGMNVSATRITETPLTSVSQHTQVTGTMSPDAPVLIAKGGPTAAPGGAETTTAEGTSGTASGQLPKTATGLPLVGRVPWQPFSLFAARERLVFEHTHVQSMLFCELASLTRGSPNGGPLFAVSARAQRREPFVADPRRTTRGR